MHGPIAASSGPPAGPAKALTAAGTIFATMPRQPA